MRKDQFLFLPSKTGTDFVFLNIDQIAYIAVNEGAIIIRTSGAEFDITVDNPAEFIRLIRDHSIHVNGSTVKVP